MPGLDLSSRDAASNGERHPQHTAAVHPGKTVTPDGEPVRSLRREYQLTTSDSTNFLQQVVTSRKGLGMVAIQDIKRGTRIISEEAILTLTLDNIQNSDKRLLQKLRQLSPSQHEQLADLSDDKQKICPKAYKVFASELEKHHQYSGRYLAAAAHDFARLHAGEMIQSP